MSSTCFEPKGSSSGRRLCVQLWYGMVYFVYMQKHKLSCRGKTACNDACKTHRTIPVCTTVFLKMNPRVRNM